MRTTNLYVRVKSAVDTRVKLKRIRSNLYGYECSMEATCVWDIAKFGLDPIFAVAFLITLEVTKI